jgi:hypothetical protein
MKWIVPLVLFAVGLLHLAPAVGVAGGERLAALYGPVPDDPGLQLLLRHRAVLFGLLGVFLVAAALRAEWHGVALGAAVVSVGSFLWLAGGSGPLSPQVGRVVIADAVALVALAVGVAVHLWRRGTG